MEKAMIRQFEEFTRPLANKIPKELKEKLKLKKFMTFDVPMLGYIGPQIKHVGTDYCEIVFPLNRKTKNHLNSMYFGALSCGADLAGGIIAMQVIDDMGENVSLVFKDFQAEFLKRAEGPTHFICRDGDKIKALVERAVASGERENETVEVIATVPSKLGDEPVAKFKLTISLKKRS